MGSHIDSGQATLFQENDFVGQGCDRGEFKRSRTHVPWNSGSQPTKGGRLGS
jgi:hypothetical protein